MRRYLIPVILAAAACAPAPALASGDSCEPGWSLDFSAKPRCSNIPALVPGNDTRANLMLLIADRHGGRELADPVQRPTLDWPDFRDRLDGKRPDPQADDYAAGEGSRCLSNEAGAKAFSDAVAAAKGLAPGEAAALAEARAALAPVCAGGEASKLQPPAVQSAQGRAFADYLKAAAAFYVGRFDEAAPAFARLSGNGDPWLSEAATYMVARNSLNRMQAGAFDEYGAFKGADSVGRDPAREASANLDAYLAKYPSGRYAASARGLMRRVEWLSGDRAGLAARYAALMGKPAAARGLTDGALADEFDNKAFAALKPGDTRDPVILAVIDLMALRKPDPGETKPPRPDLGAQREAFASNPDLLSYLEAAVAFYGDNDPRAVIQGIPDDARRKDGNHLWFSRQFLRGLALEAVKDRNARGFWKELAEAAGRPLDRTTAELALAINDERRGDPADAFAPGSPVSSPAIRTLLLVNAAGPDLLRARARDQAAPGGNARSRSTPSCARNSSTATTPGSCPTCRSCLRTLPRSGRSMSTRWGRARSPSGSSRAARRGARSAAPSSPGPPSRSRRSRPTPAAGSASRSGCGSTTSTRTATRIPWPRERSARARPASRARRGAATRSTRRSSPTAARPPTTGPTRSTGR